MSKLFDTVKVLHLEPTDVCQAACPSCSRETDPNFNKKLKHYLTIDNIKQLIPDRVVKQLEKMFMCGNYGDPAASEAIDIVDYFRSINDDITIGMNTNGGLQTPQWWASLAKRFVYSQDYVVFSIDGLRDTNHIYRRNVIWDKVMANAQAYIRAGGPAHWDMLVYEHNEHQVDECQQLARDMGFKWFRAKVSKRKPTVDWLKLPKGWSRPHVTDGVIDCYRNNDESLYLSAKGIFHPCCWLNFSNDTIDEFDSIQQSWTTDQCHPVCKMTCSSSTHVTNFTSQWQKDVQLC